jgi:hypothetical protein
MSRALRALLFVLAITLACTTKLGEGAWGTFRYIGMVKGQAPLDVLPPTSDRNGNVYTLYGAIGKTEIAAFVSRAAGGSLQACTLTKGDVFGAHGWVGFAQDRAWYWSGDALVVVPAREPCAPVLDRDPGTNVDLRFRAVVPWVREAPSRTTLVALVQSPTDTAPFAALVDLDLGIATNIARLDVAPQASVSVLGVGTDPGGANGVVLVSITGSDGAAQMKGLFFDTSANVVAAANVSGAPPPEYGVLGYLQVTAKGTAVGLTSLGTLVVFNRAGGGEANVDASITPFGVHRWDDALWLVGQMGQRPVVAPIDDDGHVGAAAPWGASERAAASLAGTLAVSDDRSYPSRDTSWAQVTTAIGPFPFLSAHSPWPHAPGTTVWAVAGPSFSSNGAAMTSLAVAPVGIAYP